MLKWNFIIDIKQLGNMIEYDKISWGHLIADFIQNAVGDNHREQEYI
jgi:hypothetical protein